jgi:hypothetical protein
MKTVVSQQSQRIANAQQADATEANVGTFLAIARIVGLHR